MLFKEIFDVFKGNSLMQRAYERSYEMLDLTNNMFKESKTVLRETDHNKIEFDINNQDSEVNKYQREVRKDVFNHLTMAGTDELSSGLILVSIVIDIERIGDYTKNIVELAMNHAKKLPAGKYEEELQKIERAVEDNFLRTIECFQTENEQDARALLKEYSAVTLAVYFRSLKRIHSHLRNITTSIVNPFHRIGFKPKKKKKNKKIAK
jgi:phosphate uptake regulator